MRLAAFHGAVFASAIALASHGHKATSASHSATVNQSKNQANTTPASNPPAPVIITVQPGDYLDELATANNTTAQRLYDANLQIDNPDLIYPGEELRVPSPTETLANRPMPDETPVVTAVASQPQAASSYTAPAPTPAAQSAPAVGSSGVWNELANCESGGNWAINTGNGFYGGLQFTLSSWESVGGSGLPSNASASEQISRAQLLQARQGWGAWPACSAKLGL